MAVGTLSQNKVIAGSRSIIAHVAFASLRSDRTYCVHKPAVSENVHESIQQPAFMENARSINQSTFRENATHTHTHTHTTTHTHTHTHTHTQATKNTRLRITRMNAGALQISVQRKCGTFAFANDLNGTQHCHSI